MPPMGANSSACGFISMEITNNGNAARQLRSIAKQAVSSISNASTLSTCPQAAPFTSTAGFSA